MTKTRPFLSMCYGDPSATEVPPCCETATKKLTFSTTSVLLLLNMPLSLSRATIFRRQKNPRRVYRPKIAGILFVCNEPEGKYYTVPVCNWYCHSIMDAQPRSRPWESTISFNLKVESEFSWENFQKCFLHRNRYLASTYPLCALHN